MQAGATATMATTSVAAQARPHRREEPGAALSRLSGLIGPVSFFPPLEIGFLPFLKPPLTPLRDQNASLGALTNE